MHDAMQYKDGAGQPAKDTKPETRTRDMPTIRTLVTDPVNAATSGPTAKGGDGAALALPSFISTAPAIPASVDALPDASSGPYIVVATNRNGKWAQLKAAGVQEGEFAIVTADKIVKAHPLRYWLVNGDIFRTKMDSLGNITHATRDLSNTDLDEHAVALIIADVGTAAGNPFGLLPVKADFRRTWSAPGIVGMKAVRAAAEAGWATAAPENAVAAAFAAPFGRVLLTANTSRKVSRSSGNPYFAADATATAADAPSLQRLAAALQDKSFVEELTAAHVGYKNRCDALAKLCK